MKIVAYDTETNGLPLFGQPSHLPGQPHIVQLALVHYDTEDGTRNRFSSLVRPDGWRISEEMTAIHGISHEQAMEEGLREDKVVEIFMDVVRASDLRVAHNRNFDDRIIRIALKRYFSNEIADEYRDKYPGECTVLLSTPIVKMPPTGKMVKAGFLKYKAPKLAEALKFFTGRDLEGAHTATADAEACLDILLAIQAHKEKEAAGA